MPSQAKPSRPRLKNPKGGLTAAGRAHYKKTEGANLKPGVKGPADTPEKMRRKGSFLRRFYANLRCPLVDKHGKPTRLALAAHAWGEPVPKTEAAARKLAAKGAKLLAKYQATKQVRKKTVRSTSATKGELKSAWSNERPPTSRADAPASKRSR